MIKIYRDKNYNNSEFEIIKTNDDIINKIASEYDFKKSILLYGDVQSGKTKNIINIIKKLFQEDKIDYVFYVVGNNTELKLQNYKRFCKEIKEVQIFNAEKKDLSNALPYMIDEKAVITVLKQHFNVVKDVIENVFDEKNILIIDDEADDHSISESNKQIINSLLKKDVGLISCTATPFLNLYFTEDIYDSYYKLIPGEGYCGINDFEDNKIIIKDSYVENLEMLYYKTLIEWANTTYKYRNEINDSQILFNFSTKTDIHEEIFDSVFEICEKIKRDKLDDDLIKKIDFNEEIDFNGVKEVIIKSQESGIKISNGQNQNDSNHKIKNKGYEIIIGGIYLSRGITYDNLISEVLLNVSEEPSAHTIIQRARWCGYRKNKEHIKIYLNKKANEAFGEVLSVNALTINHTLNGNVTYKEKADEILPVLKRIKI